MFVLIKSGPCGKADVFEKPKLMFLNKGQQGKEILKTSNMLIRLFDSRAVLPITVHI